MVLGFLRAPKIMTVYKIQVICKRLEFILEGACALDELEVRGLPRAHAAVSAFSESPLMLQHLQLYPSDFAIDLQQQYPANIDNFLPSLHLTAPCRPFGSLDS